MASMQGRGWVQVVRAVRTFDLALCAGQLEAAQQQGNVAVHNGRCSAAWGSVLTTAGLSGLGGVQQHGACWRLQWPPAHCFPPELAGMPRLQLHRALCTGQAQPSLTGVCHGRLRAAGPAQGLPARAQPQRLLPVCVHGVLPLCGAAALCIAVHAEGTTAAGPVTKPHGAMASCSDLQCSPMVGLGLAADDSEIAAGLAMLAWPPWER